MKDGIVTCGLHERKRTLHRRRVSGAFNMNSGYPRKLSIIPVRYGDVVAVGDEASAGEGEGVTANGVTVTTGVAVMILTDGCW